MSAKPRRLGVKAVGSPADAQFVRQNIQDVLQKVEAGGTVPKAGKPLSWTLQPTQYDFATLTSLPQQVVCGPVDQLSTGKQPSTHEKLSMDIVPAFLHPDSWSQADFGKCRSLHPTVIDPGAAPCQQPVSGPCALLTTYADHMRPDRRFMTSYAVTQTLKRCRLLELHGFKRPSILV